MKKGTAWMTALATVSAAFVLSACGTSTVEGTPAAPVDVTTTTTSALVPLIDPNKPVLDSPQSILDDVALFWEERPSPIKTNVKLIGLDGAPSCDGGETVFRESTAAFCGFASDGTIFYSLPKMSALMSQPHGDMTATIILAHEYGHVIQSYAGAFAESDGTPVEGVTPDELSADCLSGFYVAGREFSSDEVDAGLKLTTIGTKPVRNKAFRFGMAQTKPNVCLSRYESLG